MEEEIRGISYQSRFLVGHHILLRKNRFFSRARDTRARSLGFAFFCFHNLHTRVLKRGIFSTGKKEKVTFKAPWLSANCSQLSKTWEELPKKSDVFRKMSEKKRKTSELSQENSDVFSFPFGEGCESKKCKIPGMRARVKRA